MTFISTAEHPCSAVFLHSNKFAQPNKQFRPKSDGTKRQNPKGEGEESEGVTGLPEKGERAIMRIWLTRKKQNTTPSTGEPDVAEGWLHPEHTITQGKGIYYNCNAHKARYKNCCLGKLERGDNSKDEGLLEALSYITKIDAFARLVLPGNARTFGRGEVRSLKNRKRTKRGR